MTSRDSIVVLVDGNNTLLDNDLLQDDQRRHLEREFGVEPRDRYWKTLVDLFTELGYRDYHGALQRLRTEHPRNQQLLAASGFLMDYPFADRLYAGVLDVLRRLGRGGGTFILTDGVAVVFQPRKVEHSGIFGVADGDKSRILAAVKAAWGDRVTTVLPRQGQFALDQKVLQALPAPDVAIERIGDLLAYELPGLVPALSAFTPRLEAAR